MADGGNVIFRFTGDTSQLNNTINTLSKSVGSAFTKIGSTIAGISAGMVAGLSSAINRFDTLNNYPKVLSNLGISGEEAKESIDELSKAIDGLPTALNDAASGVQRLTAKNSDVKKSTKYFIAMNDAIIAGNAPIEQQRSAIEQLTQAYSKGRPDMMEWRNLMTAMPGQLKQVAKAMGMASTDELYEAFKDNKISMDDFMDTLVELDENGSEEFQSFAEQARNSTDSIGTAIVNVKNRIQKGFATILDSMNEVAKNTSLGSIASGINKISSSLKNFLDKIGGAIKNNKNFASLMEKIAKGIDKITKAVDKLDEKKMAKFVDIALGLAKLSPILLGIGKTLPQVTGKITSFSGKISKIFGTTIPSVIGGVFSGGAIITAVVGALGFLEQTTEGKVSEMINNIAEQLPSMLRIALNTINSRLPSILLAGTMMLEKMLTTIMQNAPMIMNIVTTLLTQFTTTLFQNLPIILGTIQELFISLTEQLIPQIPTLLQSTITGIMNTLVTLTNPDNLQRIFDCSIKLITELGTGLSNAVADPEFWKKVGEVISGIAQVLLGKDNLTKMIKAGIELTKNIGIGLVQGIPHLFDAVGEVADGIAKDWSTGIDDLWIKIKGKLSGKSDEAISMEQKDRQIWRNFMWDFGEQGIGNPLMGGAKKGVDENKSGFISAIGDATEESKTAMTDPLKIDSPSKVFEGFGENIIQGLINGINGMVGALFGRIRSIALNVISVFSNILRIGSPSKVFEKLGIFTMQGYENGVVKQLPKTEQILSNGMTNLMKDVDTAMLQSQFENSFGLSPSLNQSINSQAPQVNVSVQNNMQTDFMGNLVNNIKTYSNGSRNDYNYGAV